MKWTPVTRTSPITFDAATGKEEIKITRIGAQRGNGTLVQVDAVMAIDKARNTLLQALDAGKQIGTIPVYQATASVAILSNRYLLIADNGVRANGEPLQWDNPRERSQIISERFRFILGKMGIEATGRGNRVGEYVSRISKALAAGIPLNPLKPKLGDDGKPIKHDDGSFEMEPDTTRILPQQALTVKTDPSEEERRMSLGKQFRNLIDTALKQLTTEQQAILIADVGPKWNAFAAPEQVATRRKMDEQHAANAGTPAEAQDAATPTVETEQDLMALLEGLTGNNGNNNGGTPEGNKEQKEQGSQEQEPAPQQKQA